MKIVIVGDIHAKASGPQSVAYQNFFTWFLSSKFNSKDYTFLQVGDFFDSSTLTGELAFTSIRFFQEMECSQKIVLQGNHDYRPRWGSALDFLRRAGVKIVQDPQILSVSGYPVMCLPYMYYHMKDIGEQFAYEYRHKARLVVGHFADRNLFGTELDIGFLTGHVDGCTVDHICLGHVHAPGDNYIGSVFPTSYSERGQARRVWVIDTESGEKTEHALPVFLDYLSVPFDSDPMDYVTSPYPVILDILNAPSVKDAMEKFVGLPIRQVITADTGPDSVDAAPPDSVDLDGLVNAFVSGLPESGVKQKVQSILGGYQ